MGQSFKATKVNKIDTFIIINNFVSTKIKKMDTFITKHI